MCGFVVVVLNIQSLVKHVDKLKDFVKNCKPDLVYLSESHVTDDILDVDIAIGNYHLLILNSNSRFTGGICMYVCKEYSATVTEEFLLNKITWARSQ